MKATLFLQVPFAVQAPFSGKVPMKNEVPQAEKAPFALEVPTKEKAPAEKKVHTPLNLETKIGRVVQTHPFQPFSNRCVCQNEPILTLFLRWRLPEAGTRGVFWPCRYAGVHLTLA
jgi:hypothetical protein